MTYWACALLERELPSRSLLSQTCLCAARNQTAACRLILVSVNGVFSAQMRLVLLGNAGAGKSTMASRIIGGGNIPRLSLDTIAWDEGPKRKQLDSSLRKLHDFIQASDQWIIEGCYSDLIEAALPHCTELRFLNPGVEVCVAQCHRRPWEPEKFSSPEDQNAMLHRLIEWVKDYESRDDEFGLRRHRQLFNSFRGRKREYTSVKAYDED